ncbi:hypothetical protein [Frankia sp. QA3]|uniref:hypothetical protein n=1 Tax=Frankia sp. QA3 TaxID=710111 RepID=UPI000269C083|nr:hypothetical protein [Frankia sp. QA3]EIV92737.1 hypothetical protein FraQA3DRAFT_2350 [Frankia sp. QA3]
MERSGLAIYDDRLAVADTEVTAIDPYGSSRRRSSERGAIAWVVPTCVLDHTV